MAVDPAECFVYLGCDNLNVYQFPLSASSENKKRATLTHKKKITSMTLTERYLVTGDAQGLMYIWELSQKECEVLPLKTFAIHEGKG